MKIAPIFKAGLTMIFVLSLQFTAQAQKCDNVFRAGVNYGFLTDNDDSGFMFYNQYNRCISKMFEASLSASYFNSTRYSSASKEFTSMKTYKMLDLSAGLKAFQTKKFILKVGAGPSIRQRAELDSSAPSGAPLPDSGFRHAKAFDFGYHAYFENDFFVTDNLIISARLAGFDYNEGSSLFSLGLSMGYQF